MLDKKSRRHVNNREYPLSIVVFIDSAHSLPNCGRLTGNSEITGLLPVCRPSDQKRAYMVRAINKYASPRRLDFGWCNAVFRQ